MSDIAIVIVLYNALIPKYALNLSNVPVIVVDNTPNRILEEIPNSITYIPLKQNTGIAHALNVGVSHAISLGIPWVLTMDQDSVIPDNMIPIYSQTIKDIPQDIAILAPQINVYKGEHKQSTNNISEINEALSSGSLIRSDVYKMIGGFKDMLFIDEVDFDYCWNARKHGFKIWQINSIVMQHQLGETKEYSLFGKHLFYIMNESPLRHYYMQRNQLYVRNLYSSIFPSIKPTLTGLLSNCFKILFFEKKSIKKLKARYLGYKDYKNNRFGICPYNI